MAHRTPRLLAAAALLAVLPFPPGAAPPAAGAGEPFDYVRIFVPAGEGSGLWSGIFPARAGEGEVVGVAVAADWWDGPGDPRVGNPKLAAMEGIVYEIRRGDGPWVPLPPCGRDLRLTARAEAPADAEALTGGKPEGAWSVRQAAGGAYPHRLRLEFTCRGNPLLVRDLAVRELRLPALDPKPVVGRPYIRDRVENPVLEPGAAVEAVAVVVNRGARPSKEVDLDLVVAPWGEIRGRRLGFIQVPALEPGAEAEVAVSGKIPEDLAEEGGIWELLAVIDPRGTQREVETLNNSVGRAFRLQVPDKRDRRPDDLRHR